MPAIDPKMLRFLALLSAPLFTLIQKKLGLDVPLEVQEMLVGTVALYLLGSHGKEALVQVAQAKAATAAAAVTPASAPAIIQAAATPAPAQPPASP
jgi:hypothetical protein